LLDKEGSLPLYEYKCKSCGRRVEKIQKFSDPPLTTCEVCQGQLERLVSSPAIQFKGSGWYVTDYAKKSPPASESHPTASSESSESKKEKEPAKPAEPAQATPSKD
jgi:putative FmdB family regulatory protein